MNDDWMNVSWTKEQVVQALPKWNLTFEQLMAMSGWSRDNLRALLKSYAMDD